MINIRNIIEKNPLFFGALIVILCMTVLGLSVELGSKTYSLNIQESRVESLKRELKSLKTALNKSLEESSKRDDFIGESGNLKNQTESIILLMSESLKTVYYIRNEILYHNSKVSYLEASYRATYLYLIAKKNELDPWLASAVAICESNFDQDVVSDAGAIGTFQLMPLTARIYDMNPKKYEQNVSCGVRFLRDLLDQYEGDLTLALAHYNGGSRPYYALKNYEETQKYVKKVLHIYKSMKGKYGG